MTTGFWSQPSKPTLLTGDLRPVLRCGQNLPPASNRDLEAKDSTAFRIDSLAIFPRNPRPEDELVTRRGHSLFLHSIDLLFWGLYNGSERTRPNNRRNQNLDFCRGQIIFARESNSIWDANPRVFSMAQVPTCASLMPDYVFMSSFSFNY